MTTPSTETRQHQRRPGAPLWSLFFCAVGLIYIAPLLLLFLREIAINHFYKQTECTVRASVVERTGSTPSGKAPAKPNTKGLYRPTVEYVYTVNGVVHVSNDYASTLIMQNLDEAEVRQVVARFKPGQKVPCWYSSSNPSKAVLVQGYGTPVLPFLISGAIIALGVAGLFIYLDELGLIARARR